MSIFEPIDTNSVGLLMSIIIKASMMFCIIKIMKRKNKRVKHLWEIKHSYYCSEGNFYSNECSHEYESWEDFYLEWGDADHDYNLLFRWDWLKKEEEKEPDTLIFFWICQRKGQFQSTSINKIERKEEEKVKSFLLPRMKHLFKLWEPLV